MSRCSLSRVVLMSKILDMGTPKQLLASALDPPCLTNIILTIRTLKQVILSNNKINLKEGPTCVVLVKQMCYSKFVQ